EKLYFCCDGWLSPDRGTERTLTPAQFAVERGEYKVLLYTGQARGSGTDANVFVELIGDRGTSGRLDLEDTGASFRRGRCDAFDLSCTAVGSLLEMAVGHDGSGGSPGWYLEMAEVTDVRSGKTYYLECNSWLDEAVAAGSSTKVLKASATDPRAAKTTYLVTVHTSNTKGAGTDANVFLELRGEAGWGVRHGLDAKGRNDFERGSKDEFEIVGKDLGELLSVKIGHDGKGFAAAWHLSKVEVCHARSMRRWTFLADRWLPKDKGKGSTEIELSPAGSANAIAFRQYVIEVLTSDIRGAGTDANVHAKLHGTEGESEDICLQSSQNSRNPFERGQLDKFTIESSAPIGGLTRLQIWTDGRGVLADWHLRMVVVVDVERNRRHFFWCDDWLNRENEFRKVLE
ncbi:unnamed protein product, partial [Ostreobium quekettii]